MINEFLLMNPSTMALIGNNGPQIFNNILGIDMGDLVDQFFSALFSKFSDWLLGGVMGIYDQIYRLNFVDFYDRTTYIPGLTSIGTIASAIAWGLIFVFLVISLLKAIAGPITGGQQSNPINIFGKIIAVAMVLAVSHSLITSLCDIGLGLTNYIRGDFATAIGMPSDLTAITVDWDSGAFGTALLGLIFCIALAYNIVMACINQGERFIMFGIYATIAPIPIAFIADDSNSDIPKNFFITLFSQMLAIMFNLIVFSLLAVKIQSISAAKSTGASAGIVDWIVCIGLASVASHSENLINAIGLKSMPTPQAASDLVSGVRGATAAAGAAVATTAAAAKGVGFLGRGIGHAEGLSAPLSGNKYDPAQKNTFSSTAGSGTSASSDGKLITKKEAEKRDGRQAGNTGYEKGKGLTAPERSYVENAKQSARIHGETNDKQWGATNLAGIAHTKMRMDAGQKERENAIAKVNDVLNSENGLATATGKDLSTALNLEKSMPNIDFNNDKAIRKNSDGTLTATGYITKTDAYGNAYRESKEFTFGDRDTISSAGLGAEFRPVTEEGNFGMVTDYAHTSDLDSMSMVDNNYLNTTTPKPGQEIERHSSGEWMDNTFKLSDRLGDNVSIEHAARIDHDFASIGTVTNKDGTQAQKLYYTTANTSLIQNGGYANGLMLDNSKIINNGNGYYTMEATWANEKQIDNKGDNAVDVVTKSETMHRLMCEDAYAKPISSSNTNNSNGNSNASNNNEIDVAAGSDPTVEDKKGIAKALAQAQNEIDEHDRKSDKPGSKKESNDPD